MWGSTVILKWIERFPVIITIGAAVLAWTASKMIVAEPFLKGYFTNGFVKYGFELLVIAAVIVSGIYKTNRSSKQVDESEQEVLVRAK
jgi:predicted tellurium resistance membrane protein TerC